VSITWDNLTGFHGVMNVLLDVVTSPVLTVLLFKLKQEVKAFLVSKPVERSSETVHTCRERQIWV